MRIIDRYMLRQFVQVYCICFVSLTGLYIVIDAFGNLDEFIAYAESQGSLFKVISRYYGYRSLAFFDRISGMLALISAMFTVTWIQRHQELTALLSAGIRTFRVIAPVVAAAISISLLAALNRELVLPRMHDVLSQNAQDLKGETARDVRPQYDNASDILLRGSKAFANKKRVSNPDFLLPATLNRFGKHLAASNAYYHPPQEEERPGGYLFQGVKQPKNLDAKPSLYLQEKPVILTPHDTDWLKPGECFVVSGVTFHMLTSTSSWHTYSSTLDLIRGLASPSLDFGADVRVAVHGRVVQPLLDVTLLFLGLPLVVSRHTRNVFLAIGLCGALAVTFYLVVMGCQYLGASYLVSPALSAWMPLLIFVPIAVAMSDPLRE